MVAENRVGAATEMSSIVPEGMAEAEAAGFLKAASIVGLILDRPVALNAQARLPL